MPLPPKNPINYNDPAFAHVRLAMFIGGFSTFALLYATQGILPQIALHFAVTPASASLTVSVATIALACILIPAGMLSNRFGRERVMKYSLLSAAIIALLTAFANNFTHFVYLRALLGVALAGLPATAMAYIGEEISPNAQGRAFGLYIAGNVLGGMSGRIVSVLLCDFISIFYALLLVGLFGVLAACLFWVKLPASQQFRPRPLSWRAFAVDSRIILRHPRLPWLFASSFLLMGTFVAVYNYIGFRLSAPPFALPASVTGFIFLLYFLGTGSSMIAGRLVNRLGHAKLLWISVLLTLLGLLLSLPDSLLFIISSLALFTFGFFAAHTTASGWVTQCSGRQRALATSLYLFSLYVGSSIIGSGTGIAWQLGNWTSVLAVLGVILLLALLIALYLRLRA